MAITRPMCGEEDDDAPMPDFPLVAGHTCCRLGVHNNDVVRITEASGVKPKIGYFEDFDDKWGAAIVWMDGSRTWYPWDRWYVEKHPGWRFELADKGDFIRAPDFEVAPEEPGRGLLPRPPLSSRPQARTLSDLSTCAAMDFTSLHRARLEDSELCEIVECADPELVRLTGW